MENWVMDISSRGLGAAIFILLAGLATGELRAADVRPRAVAPRAELGAEERNTIDIIRRASPAVVYITTLRRLINPWTRNVREVPRGTGSGFLWDEQGHVVTNYHVIANAQGATLRLADQRAYRAELVGASPAHDLAVLRVRIPGRKPAPIPLGTSRDLVVGQKVIAIGNPFGLDYTVTTGIVSALDRSITGDNDQTIHHLIQTDAAINPGNSGGPLLDSAGRLVGVNTAIYSPSGASAGIGFAIPADVVNRVVPELIAHGRYLSASLGIVTSAQANAAIMRQMGVKGVLILEVEEGSAAAAAGLRGSRVRADGAIVPGDVLQAVDGVEVGSLEALARLLDDKRIGDRVALRILRNGRPLQVTVALEGRRG
ncbi:MAG: 2-alkenal reductase [Betaproteobacteria bacterium CG2_30_68_42]|nr:MAG: 2-alkenal reductase [Betaproteobacteria bacterium CG2_30_68_42]PIX75229.1 MAG: 2-alkenal reductase [Rhodocyclales bacterium CG_4_10_14_3_um_filter_68_10]